MNYNISSRKEKNVYLILILTLIIDALNGVLINNFGINNTFIGVIYRSFILIYFLINYIAKGRKKFALFISMFLLFSIQVVFCYYYFNGTIKSIAFDLEQILRIALTIIICSSLMYMIKKEIIKKEIIYKIIYDSTNILIILYVIGLLLGIGSSTYGDAGYKSLFNANNALNITVIILFIFDFELYIKERRKINIFKSLILISILILLGSKSSFIFIGLYFLLRLLLEKNFKRMFKILMVIIFSIIVIYIIINLFFYNQFIDIINRQKYFLFKEYNNKSLSTFFLSGRDVFLDAAYEYIKKYLNIISLFFGFGSYNMQLNIANYIGIYSFKNIEMDFFDILFSNGIIGIIITYGYSIKIFVKNFLKDIKLKKYDSIISFICIIIFSFTGGHVFTDSMASTFLALVLVTLKY